MRRGVLVQNAIWDVCGTSDNIYIADTARPFLVPSQFAPCAFFYYVEYLLKITKKLRGHG